MASHIQAAESDDHPRCDWTETHTQLLNMGGFRLIDQHGIPTRLEHADIPASHVHILEIHPNEIDDGSKSDVVAKAIIMLQTLWFILGSDDYGTRVHDAGAYDTQYFRVCFLVEYAGKRQIPFGRLPHSENGMESRR